MLLPLRLCKQELHRQIVFIRDIYIINVIETLLSPRIKARIKARIKRILSLKERPDVRSTINLVAFDNRFMYKIHRIIARPKPIRGSVDPLVIGVHLSGGLVMEVF